MTTETPTDETETTDAMNTTDDDDRPSVPYIRCSCGFEVAGLADDDMRWAMDDHDCPEVEYGPRPWYSYVFSFWGFVIAIVIVYGLVAILTAGR